MATKPTSGQRWPRNQESRRVRTIENAQDAIEILDAARQELTRNPIKAELYIADAQRYLERIAREMVEAKQGVE
jgi:CYTH domain-containing protein